ncbi:L-aspartate oxidase [Helicobacter sp. MIT 14-3879]|uniref:L-aspartate oxidase n=1 Tax=Helicobacter sp. MIT 14-3879 TaxID=2040649 RepID=UPI000E1F45B5|nr:FAD-dependent oxidoreductase [Helicobacter sp. MIT 14-3879]RDU62906.1 L-aspartate oxidase [Helicobacter sp. MIT 14-3879]
MKYDVIIIGAGVAGLYCAKHLPQNLKVLILCKEQPWECNTFYAQGGITIANGKDDIKLHIKDTINAGSNTNNINAVRILSENSIEILNELLQDNFNIDKDKDNKILLAKEGGHSISRIIHSNGDGTGRMLHTHLIKNLKHTLWKNANVIDLLIEDDKVYGVCVSTKNKLINIYANNVIIASGGVGGLFKYHTNAYTISSDIHGIILEHNLSLNDMEMLQFHPTVFINTTNARKQLISEAVRGDGGIVVDNDNNRFLFDYDKRGELAPRDIVSRAIFDYCNKYSQKAYINLSAFSKKAFQNRFPNIYRQLTSYGLDIPKDKIPIFPAFHYSMGGITCDLDTRVLGMKNLYAIGECANNGLHGANRLASNSLLEGLVFGKIAAKSIVSSNISTNQRHFPINNEVLQKEGDLKLKNVLRDIMWNKVGIARTKSGLNSALSGVEVMLLGNIGRLLRLRLLVAKKIITSALNQKNSIGAHYLIKE